MSSLTIQARDIEKENDHVGQAVFTAPLSEQFLSLLLECDTEQLKMIAQNKHIDPIIKPKGATGILSIYYAVDDFPNLVKGLQERSSGDTEELVHKAWLMSVETTNNMFTVHFLNGSSLTFSRV